MESRAAARLANPSQIHHFTSCPDGVDLDDEIWDVRFNFIGENNHERRLGKYFITFSHLVAIKEEQGYDGSYSMYYPKVLGLGHAGMDLIMSDDNVEEMLDLYGDKKVVNITVISGSKHDLLSLQDINIGDAYEAQGPIYEIGNPIVYEINDEGVLFPSQGSSEADSHECTPMEPNDS
ncbi:hypothetical protein D1007_06471 [Hordeum vulgare]|nr:hypothetical protein D1007_06471 [Hordeum vulgare]